MLPPDLRTLAQHLLDNCRAKGVMLATAESCTGGLIAAALTAIPGSSAVLERGLVTYSNQAKMDLLGVPAATLENFGAVSEETARAMALGALAQCPAAVGLTIAVTGIAGPDGGSAEKPVGLVYIATASRGHPALVTKHSFAGDRDAVREQTARAALLQASHHK